MLKNNLRKIGKNVDKRCNIQDIAGNVVEWSTETLPNGSPYTLRGGNYFLHWSSASDRLCYSPALGGDHIQSFRTLLCVK